VSWRSRRLARPVRHQQMPCPLCLGGLIRLVSRESGVIAHSVMEYGGTGCPDWDRPGAVESGEFLAKVFAAREALT
jgi:hypothetical protein